MRIARHFGPLILAGFAAGLVPALAAGQGVTVISSGSMKAGGALGMVLRMAGTSNMTSTSYVAGHKMRTDNKDASTIIDVDAGRFITLDNKKKTYSSVTLEELAAALNSAQAEAKAERAKAAKEAKNEKPSDVEWTYDVKAEKTGEREKIGGYDATRNLITVTVTAREKGKAAGPNDGALVALMDIWTSNDAPNAAAMKEFQTAYAQRMKTEFSSQAKGLEAAFGSDPRMKTAMQATAKEMAKVQGVPLRNTTSFIVVPEGVAFSRQAALGADQKATAEAKADEAKPKPKGGLFGKLKAAAQQVEQQENQKEEGKTAPAAQSTLVSFTNEVQEIKRGVPPDVFSIPAGYKEVKSDVGKSR